MENDREINLEKDLENAQKNRVNSQEGKWEKIVNSSFVMLLSGEMGAADSAETAKALMEYIEKKFNRRPKILIVFKSNLKGEKLVQDLKEIGVNLDEDVEGTSVNLASWMVLRGACPV